LMASSFCINVSRGVSAQPTTHLRVSHDDGHDSCQSSRFELVDVGHAVKINMNHRKKESRTSRHAAGAAGAMSDQRREASIIEQTTSISWARS
jgi:hypothetical protein